MSMKPGDGDTVEFGSLTRVELRNVWPNEARDFTPWLARHLSELGSTLGMDLELVDMEAPAGDFSVDILAKDLVRERPVVIENQMSATDHDHLGKLLTYAAAYDASAVVWLAERLRDEHRQALDWLNQVTAEGTSFFGVVPQVIRIDESRPAVQFSLVVSPSEWVRSRRTSSARPASGKGEAYRAFFQRLIDTLRDKHHFTNARVAQPANWYSFASGVSGITYTVTFAQGGRVRAELYLDAGDADSNKANFDAFLAQRDEIEETFGEKLAWERMDDRKASRIAVYRSGTINATEEERSAIQEWLVERLLRLRETFGPRLRD